MIPDLVGSHRLLEKLAESAKFSLENAYWSFDGEDWHLYIVSQAVNSRPFVDVVSDLIEQSMALGMSRVIDDLNIHLASAGSRIAETAQDQLRQAALIATGPGPWLPVNGTGYVYRGHLIPHAEHAAQ